MSISVDSIVQLKSIAGLAPWRFLYCYHCNSPSSHYGHDRKYPWSLRLHCNSCKLSWWVCKECHDQRVHLSTVIQLRRHHREKHRSRPLSDSKLPATQPTPVQTPSPTLNQSITQTPTIVVNCIKESFPRKQNLEYFTSSTLGRNASNLLARAIGAPTNANFRTADIEMMFSMSHFISLLSRPQREEFASILSLVFDSGVIDFAYDESAISQITPIQTLGQSTIAQSLHQANQSEKFESLFLSLWSDDFEPNYSKTNRGSVWIMTLTIHPPTNQFPNKKMVYPIAVGPKGKSHHKVIEKIMDDIRQMNREHHRENPLCLYNHSTKSIVKLSVHLICVTQDQPERRGFCGLLVEKLMVAGDILLISRTSMRSSYHVMYVYIVLHEMSNRGPQENVIIVTVSCRIRKKYILNFLIQISKKISQQVSWNLMAN